MTCPICGDSFKPHRYGQRYCTVQCRDKRNRNEDPEKKRARDKQRIRPARTCPVCGEQYHPTGGKQKTCSHRCAGALDQQERGIYRWPQCRVYLASCSACGVVFSSRTKRKTCGMECARRSNINGKLVRYHGEPEFRDRVLAAAHARRADKLGLGSKRLLLSYLIERDKGRCQIPACTFRSRNVAAVGSRGPSRPSMDHIIPLSRGGTHELVNMQLAHYRCNLEKNASGVGDQLRLIG